MNKIYMLIQIYDTAYINDPEYYGSKDECFEELERRGYELDDESITENHAENTDMIDNGINMAFIIKLDI